MAKNFRRKMFDEMISVPPTVGESAGEGQRPADKTVFTVNTVLPVSTGNTDNTVSTVNATKRRKSRAKFPEWVRYTFLAQPEVLGRVQALAKEERVEIAALMDEALRDLLSKHGAELKNR